LCVESTACISRSFFNGSLLHAFACATKQALKSQKLAPGEFKTIILDGFEKSSLVSLD
jgi:hypothetical protein